MLWCAIIGIYTIWGAAMGVGGACLPLHVLLHIFSFLSTKDLCYCSMVCRKWHDSLDEESPVWEQALENPALSGFLASPLILNLTRNKAKLVAFENGWNGRDCSHNIFLLGNNLTLHRNPVAQSTDAIRGKCGYLRGQHYWTVTWHKPAFGSNAVIGVATKSEVLRKPGYCGLLGSTHESWGWDISKGIIRYGGDEVDKYPRSDKQVSVSLSHLFLFCHNRILGLVSQVT